MDKLNVKAFAAGMGACFGLAMLLLGWVAIYGYGASMVAAMASIYIGYKPTFLGAIVGGIYGFIDGAIGGAIIAYVYNKVAKKK